jgi:hypothetical protein
LKASIVPASMRAYGAVGCAVVPVEVIELARIVSKSSRLRAARVDLNRIAVDDYEERLEPARDNAADRRIRPDIAKPSRVLGGAEPEVTAKEEPVDRRNPRLAPRRHSREVENLHTRKLCGNRLSVESRLASPRSSEGAGRHGRSSRRAVAAEPGARHPTRTSASHYRIRVRASAAAIKAETPIADEKGASGPAPPTAPAPRDRTPVAGCRLRERGARRWGGSWR